MTTGPWRTRLIWLLSAVGVSLIAALAFRVSWSGVGMALRALVLPWQAAD